MFLFLEVVCQMLLFFKTPKKIPARSKHGAEKRTADKLDDARIKFYIEKGAKEESMKMQRGQERFPDVTLTLYNGRRVSRVDIEKHLNSNLESMSKCILIIKIILNY